MENFNLQEKIIPLTRRKLLAKALYKDSPISYTKKRINCKPACVKPKNLPLTEKDLNKTETKLSECTEKTLGTQEFLLEIWKHCKMGLEFDSKFKIAIGNLFFELKSRSENSKIVEFFGDFYGFLHKHSVFPESLTTCLEEILGLVCFEYPLVKDFMTVEEGECLLGVSICKFTIKKIKQIRKVNFNGDLALNTWVLMLVLSDIDSTLFSSITRYEDNKWELFTEYSSNPGKVIQNIRKIPDFLKKNLHSPKIWNKALHLAQSMPSHPDFPELFHLVKEILQYYKLITKSSKTENFIKIIPSKVKSCSNSARSFTPANRTLVLKRTIKHCRSSSRTLPQKSLHETEKRTQFLFESRFNKRLIDLFTEKLKKRVSFNPEYLDDVKGKDYEKYLRFKQEYFEIHKDVWVVECVDEVIKETFGNEQNQDDETKKAVFLSFVENQKMVNPILEKVKKQMNIF